MIMLLPIEWTVPPLVDTPVLLPITEQEATVRDHIAFDTTSLGIESIDSDTRADVNSTPLVLGDAGYLIARETLLRGVPNKRWTVLSRVINTRQPTLRTRDPQSSLCIDMQSANQSPGSKDRERYDEASPAGRCN